MNTTKTIILLAALTVLLILAGNLLGGKSGMMTAFVIAVVMNFGTYWFSGKIMLRMYHAQELAKNDNPVLSPMEERVRWLEAIVYAK
ncbi:MAG: hypothetical protein EHJ94_09030 [Deltaproteobacteria bacterium]|nr:MAG: hypothetical protein EHJ94_09030 [Deltaproteobacteria bacterium]